MGSAADLGVDTEARAEERTVRGSVIEAVGQLLPRVWVRCDLADTSWPQGVDLNELEFLDCDLSGARWDGALARDLRILATERGLSQVHGMSMRHAVLPGLTVVRVVGVRLDLTEAVVDDANVRSSSLPRLQAARLRGENAHFCTGTVMDESSWEHAVLPGICFSDASLMGASFRHGTFC